MKINEIVSEDAYEYNKTHQVYWRSLRPEQQAEWERRRVQLESRARKVYGRLVRLMPAEDTASIKGVPVNVPLHGEMSWAAANWETREITVDLGCFWDLPDDCLGYVLGHEIGHFVYEKKNPGFWRKRIPAQLNRQLEMDADVYGAILAYRVGYNPKLAWSQFTRAEREAPPDPQYPNYPSVRQRQANVAAALKKDKEERDAAAKQKLNVPADQQGQKPAPTEPSKTEPQQPAVEPQTSTTIPEPPLTPAAKVDLSHAMHGIEVLLQNLAKDPEIATQMFPGSSTGDTALA